MKTLFTIVVVGGISLYCTGTTASITALRISNAISTTAICIAILVLNWGK